MGDDLQVIALAQEDDRVIGLAEAARRLGQPFQHRSDVAG